MRPTKNAETDARDAALERLRHRKGQDLHKGMMRASQSFSVPESCVKNHGCTFDPVKSEVVWPDGERWPARPQALSSSLLGAFEGEWDQADRLYVGPFVLLVEDASIGVHVDCMISTGQAQSAHFKVGMYPDRKIARSKAPKRLLSMLLDTAHRLALKLEATS